MVAGITYGRNDPCPCGSGKKYKRCCAVAASPPRTVKPQAPARFSSADPDSKLSASAKALAESVGLPRNTSTESQALALSGYHLDVLLDGVSVGKLDFKSLFLSCLAASETTVPSWKVPRRAHRALNLARYFLKAASVPGARAECGVLKGFSALLLAKIAQAETHAGDAVMHLVDSFEGLSAPTMQDAVETGPTGSVFPAHKGALAAPLEHVQRVLDDFPGIDFHKGWIPGVLKALPDTTWSFVHIDVDLYEPTLSCLQYFHPRLSPGGIIVNDDYSSPLFPGGGRAWDKYCTQHNLPFAALDTGQAVLVKGL